MKDSRNLGPLRHSVSPEATPMASGWLAHRWPEVIAAVLLVASIVLLREVPFGHDAVWQMWIARQLAHGARLYSDVLEVNPPLWFWMALALQTAAQATGTAPLEVLRLFFFAALALSLTLTSCLLPSQPGVRSGVYAGLFLAAAVVALPDFGQREHYTLLSTAPWVALVAARAEQKRVPAGLATLVALFAASGLALKPHFAIVPVALEVWLVIALRRFWAWRPELVVLSICGAAYAAAVALFAPDYLRVMVPMVLLSYGDFGKPPFFYLFFQSAALLSLLTGIGLYVIGGTRTRLGAAALVASLAFLIAYFAQQKGWRYHSLPALGMLFFCIGAEAASLRWSISRHRPAAAAFACVILLAIVETMYGDENQNPNERATTARRALEGVPRGEPVMVFAVNPSAMTMIEDLGLVWPSRLMSSWFLEAVVDGMQKGPLSRELEALGDTMRAQTLADLLCHPPRRILVDSEHFKISGRPFGHLDFYRMDPALARFLDRYRPGPTFGRYLTLDLANKAGLVPPDHCRPLS